MTRGDAFAAAIGRRLEEARVLQGVTVDSLSAHLKMSRHTWWRVVSGRRALRLDELVTVCDALQRSPAVLVCDAWREVPRRSARAA